MNCYHFLLIAISFFLIFEAFYNNLSKKFKFLLKIKKIKFLSKIGEFKFLPEKEGQRFFLYIIYLFPLIITVISPVKEEYNIFDSIKEYMSFYATALTITFTVYSFLETQKATDKTRIEKEGQREKERIERENKDFELREKELEAKRDYYRPIFVVGKDPYGYDDSKQITLLMKDEHLYLENIKYYNLQSYHGTEIGNLTSGQRIDYLTNYPYFITGQTLIGETILFGHYEKNKKVYKYLKPNKHPLEEPLSDAWGDYNTISHKKNREFEKSFFDSTRDIRLELTNFYLYFDFLFDLDEISEFIRTAVSSMEYYHRKEVKRNYNRDKQVKYIEILNMVLINFINELSNNIEYLSVENDKYKKLELLLYEFIPNRLINKNKLYTNNVINLAYFLRTIRVNMYINNKEDNMLPNTLNLLEGAFSVINVKPNLKFNSSKFRSFTLELEEVL